MFLTICCFDHFHHSVVLSLSYCGVSTAVFTVFYSFTACVPAVTALFLPVYLLCFYCVHVVSTVVTATVAVLLLFIPLCWVTGLFLLCYCCVTH